MPVAQDQKDPFPVAGVKFSTVIWTSNRHDKNDKNTGLISRLAGEISELE